MFETIEEAPIIFMLSKTQNGSDFDVLPFL
jgi:hypothetical protein